MDSAVCLGLMSVLCQPAGATGFSSGVSCGDVTDRRAVIWTRADRSGTIRAEVATDTGFNSLVFQGEALAAGDADYTVRFDLDSLSPRTRYHYRFIHADPPQDASRTGTFVTAPSPDSAAPFRFIISGDSNFAHAPFHVLGDAAEHNPDVFIWFGDTIYADVEAGGLGVVSTLAGYRQKYVQIRSDARLQDLLARTAVLVGWDDHEVVNDYSGGEPEPDLDRERIQAAYRAFFEHMPIRPANDPGDPYRTYRSFRYGSLVEVFLLDGRQYRDRSAQAACRGDLDPFDVLGGSRSPNYECIDALSEPRSYLGQDQLEWLKTGLAASEAVHKFVITDQPLSVVGLFPYDRWDGYDAERRELLEFIDANRIENVWMCSTDIHVNALNPDVTSYFRARRADYKLANGIVIPEIIVGPIATQTLRSASLEIASAAFGPFADTPLVAGLLDGMFTRVMYDLARANEMVFLAPDRFAYAVVDVSPDAGVSVIFRGYDPAEQGEQSPDIHTLYDSSSPPVLPCGLLPGLAMWLLAVPAGRALRGRAERTALVQTQA